MTLKGGIRRNLKTSTNSCADSRGAYSMTAGAVQSTLIQRWQIWLWLKMVAVSVKPVAQKISAFPPNHSWHPNALCDLRVSECVGLPVPAARKICNFSTHWGNLGPPKKSSCQDLSYCWWKKSCTTCYLWNPKIEYSPYQLVSRFLPSTVCWSISTPQSLHFSNAVEDWFQSTPGPQVSTALRVTGKVPLVVSVCSNRPVQTRKKNTGR